VSGGEGFEATKTKRERDWVQQGEKWEQGHIQGAWDATRYTNQ